MALVENRLMVYRLIGYKEEEGSKEKKHQVRRTVYPRWRNNPSRQSQELIMTVRLLLKMSVGGAYLGSDHAADPVILAARQKEGRICKKIANLLGDFSLRGCPFK
jgi:hypothetical protein